MIVFHTEKILAELSHTSSRAKRLTLTSWNGTPAKLDLRMWVVDEDEPKPGKGLTMTDEEARVLAAALNEYFSGKGSTAGTGNG